uniref:Uncharacterized protein n=1 Tax=Anguilla anguilla TaxID=7936 RepID=A0A0E9RP03_ANGAN
MFDRCAEKAGWRCIICTAEVSCRCFLLTQLRVCIAVKAGSPVSFEALLRSGFIPETLR